MTQTGLEGFVVQYPCEIIDHLNRVWNVRSLNNDILAEIGKAVSPGAKHSLNGKTEDGYSWYGKLEYKIGCANVVVLFPWSQDWNNPETQMDRSINVYSDKKLPVKVIENLLERIAYQAALRTEPQQKNRTFRLI